jgi:hypothetical protein
MTAEEIDADRDRWKALRRKGVTASEIGAIMRVEHAFGSPSRSYWEKVAGDEQPDNRQMEMGRWLEPFVAERFAAQFPGFDVERGPLASHGKRRWQMGTFDLMAWEPRTSNGRPVGGRTLVPVQIKTVRSWEGWGPAPHGNIPGAYLAQCLYEDDIAAVERSILAAINRGSGEIRYYWIQLDADAYDDIEAMRAAAQQFRHPRGDRNVPRDPAPAAHAQAGTGRGAAPLRRSRERRQGAAAHRHRSGRPGRQRVRGPVGLPAPAHQRGPRAAAVPAGRGRLHGDEPAAGGQADREGLGRR